MRKLLTHYQLLEVSESASPDMIHAAWKLLMRRYHPDNVQSGHAETARTINDAYQTLKDPEKRALYDCELREARRPIPMPHVQAPQAYPSAYPPAYALNINADALVFTFLQNLDLTGALQNASEAVIERLAQDNPIIRELLKQRRRAG